ncbi:MAG TPA: thrombospondin type 3 repeat-containing protein [Candidatus Polarisedimenticolia bacterium]|nr:thrombospondin type 3 repeat-containing protein [Candidatus Polarisedimenticolia bacterium]
MRVARMRAIVAFCAGTLPLLAANEARAATCLSAPACANNLPAHGCRLEEPTSWTCGHVPRPGDTFLVRAGHTVRVGPGDPFITSHGYIDGTVEFSEAPEDRDASGFADLNIHCVDGYAVHVERGGTLRMRKGDRLRFDSTNGYTCILTIDDGGILDIQGSVSGTSVAADGVEASIDPLLCGPASSGRTYRLTLDSLPPGASDSTLAGRRIVFQSGKAVTRQYEIVAADVAASTLTVCVDLDDAWSLGQRLTPHAVLGPRDQLPAKHPQPSPGPSEACLGPGQPSAYGCCTGPGTGTCVEALPAPGDLVAVVEDAWVEERSGFRGVSIGGSANGNDPLPTIRALNFTQRPGAFKGLYPALMFTALRPGLSLPPFEYNNIHDQSGFAPVIFKGVQNSVIRWNAVHDDGPRATSTQAGIYVIQAEPWRDACDCGSDGTVISDNILYRTVGNAICAGAARGTPSNQAMRVTRNQVFQGCTTGSTECNAIEVDTCDDCLIEDNLVYDFGVTDGTHRLGIGINIDPANVDSVVADNWVVNVLGSGINASETTTSTHNYVSHTRRESASAGRYFGNLFRDAWLGQTDGWGVVTAPRRASGNILLGLEDDLLSVAPCASGTACPAYGFYLTDYLDDAAAPILLEDNLVMGLASFGDGAAVHLPKMYPPGADVQVRHLTFDNRGRQAPLGCKRAVRDDVDAYATPSPFRLEVSDLAALNLDGCPVFDCTACAQGLDDALTNAHLRRTSLPGEDAGPASGTDAVDGQYFLVDPGYASPPGGDFNLTPHSPLLGGGRFPAGDPVGIRAFRFDRARLAAPWGGLLPFPGEQPADIANLPNDDTDGDGVIDLHDDCRALPDPGQPDADGDGVGDLCDLCLETADPQQVDRDGDGAGDACDPCPDDAGPDPDGDGVCSRVDNCRAVANPDQADIDNDASGDACDNCPGAFNRRQGDADADGVGDLCDDCAQEADPAQGDADVDGVGDACDTCPAFGNLDQSDADADGRGDPCDPCPYDAADDADTDGLCAPADNCPLIANPDQADADLDGSGDLCDNCPSEFNRLQRDLDSDGLGDLCDLCPGDAGVSELDADADGIGDRCDPCPLDALNDADLDEVCADRDNCPTVTNPGQEDFDADGVGDACAQAPQVSRPRPSGATPRDWLPAPVRRRR